MQLLAVSVPIDTVVFTQGDEGVCASRRSNRPVNARAHSGLVLRISTEWPPVRRSSFYVIYTGAAKVYVAYARAAPAAASMGPATNQPS